MLVGRMLVHVPVSSQTFSHEDVHMVRAGLRHVALRSCGPYLKDCLPSQSRT